jgi:gamma-glutamyltranspeptidase/glutathione hydrolase
MFSFASRASVLCLFQLLCMTENVIAGPYPNTEPHLGAVASEKALCSEIGIDLLKAGGNAADALVGTVFCVGVTGMIHSGLGGGGFMLVRSSNGSYEFIDFRETAPAAAFEDMYTNNTAASLYGGLARYVGHVWGFISP